MSSAGYLSVSIGLPTHRENQWHSYVDHGFDLNNEYFGAPACDVLDSAIATATHPGHALYGQPIWDLTREPARTHP